MPISKTILPALILSLSAAAFAEEFTLSSNSLPPQGTLPAAHVLNGFGCTGQTCPRPLPGRIFPQAPEASQSPCTIQMRRPARDGGIGLSSISPELRRLWLKGQASHRQSCCQPAHGKSVRILVNLAMAAHAPLLVTSRIAIFLPSTP